MRTSCSSKEVSGSLSASSRKETVQIGGRQGVENSHLQVRWTMRYVAICLVSAIFFLSTTAGANNNLLEYETALLEKTGGVYVPKTRYFDFNVAYVNKTVNCVNKALLAVNGQFPGPPIYAVEGDWVVVNVTNNSPNNVTIHWHGVKQRQTGWSDGTEYITQCPIKEGDYFLYNFTVGGQRGTAFWHAHVAWERATLHGIIVVLPKTLTYPFPTPANEFPVFIEEWWNDDVLAVELRGLASGQAFQDADALLVNGLTGPLYNCSKAEGVATIKVHRHKTYLLRIVNANLNTEVFFSLANHTFTVVEADSEYVKPFKTSHVFISPGQTTNVLITTDQPAGSFYIAAKSFQSQIITDLVDFPPPAIAVLMLAFPLLPGSALLEYIGEEDGPFHFPRLPKANDSVRARDFELALKTTHPELVPQTVDRQWLFTVGSTSLPCQPPPAQNCTFRAAAAVNNITWVNPTIALLQASYFKIPGVFATNFPTRPIDPFDYTFPSSPPIQDQLSQVGTKVSVIEYGEVVQLVLQDTDYIEFENHPFHLHGYSFYVLARGLGNYDYTTSPSTFNTYDPPLRFTVDVPSGGWVAIRFRAANPGVWLFHCHLDKHVSWGMQMAFWVKNGKLANETLYAPPSKLTAC